MSRRSRAAANTPVNIDSQVSTFVDIGRSTDKRHSLYSRHAKSIKLKIIDNCVDNQNAFNSAPLATEYVVYHLIAMSIALPGPFQF